MSLFIAENPALDSAANILKESLASRKLIVVIGECRVDYEGRGASRLELGQRIVIIKQDGAVLVHRPFGYSPVNWQPSSSLIEVTYREGVGLVVFAVRDKPREYLTIVFTRVDVLLSTSLRDPGEFVMYADENEIRSAILDNPSIIEEGLRVLSIEKQVGDGYIDIYAKDKENKHVLIELKRITATRDAVMQLYKYVEMYRSQYGETPRAILAAPAFSPTALETSMRLGIECKYIDLKSIWEYLKKKQARKKTLFEFHRTDEVDKSNKA